MKNTECYSYNTTDINNQARIHPIEYYQHFYLLKCMFLLQTGRNQVRLLLLCTRHQQKKSWLFCCLCMQRSVALSVHALHFIFIWNFFGILKGPLQPKKLFSQYMEFWINQLKKNKDVLHTDSL